MTGETGAPGWAELPLEDLLSRPLAYGVLKPGDFIPGGVPLVRIQDVHTGRLDPMRMHRISSELHAEFKGTELRGGELLFSVVGTLGKVVEVDSGLAGANISRALCVLGLSPRVRRDYLKQHLQSALVQDWVTREGRGNAQAVLNLGLLRAMLVPVPPLPEQRKIAAILSSVDEAIEGTQAVIDQLQVVKKAMMADLLTRGIPGRHKTFKQTEIGEVPVEWEVVELERLCSDIVDCPHETPVYAADGYAVVRTADVIPGRILLNHVKRTSEAVYRSRIRRLEPLPGDVFYSREGERFGIAAPVPATEKVCLGKRMMHFRASSQNDPRYLCWLLNSPLVYGQAVGGVGGSTSPHVNVGDIKRFRVPRPPQKEQIKIGRLLAEIESRTEVEEILFQGWNGVKSALMSVLLSGEVRVKVDEKAAA